MKKQWYLLSYDISNAKRLQKFHYRLKKQALSLQKSVFLLEVDAKELQQIMQLVERYTHTRDDDVRLYPIKHPRAIWSAGIQQSAFADKGVVGAIVPAITTKVIQVLKQMWVKK